MKKEEVKNSLRVKQSRKKEHKDVVKGVQWRQRLKRG
jgi:hypothetical protein